MAPLATYIANSAVDQRFHAARMRRTVLEMAYAGSTVHIGCESLSQSSSRMQAYSAITPCPLLRTR